MTKPQPDPKLQPSQAIAEILTEIQRYSEAIGLVELVKSLTDEAEDIRRNILALEEEYNQLLKTGLDAIENKLELARGEATTENYKLAAEATKLRSDLKLLRREIDETQAAEEDRVEDLRIEKQGIQAARKALASERAAFEGDQKRLNRSR